MILFASPEFEHTAAALRESVSRLRPGRFRVGHFDNGELFIEIETPVAGEHCLILGSISPPEPQLLSTLLLGHTLRKKGAKQITGVFPYLAYSRQDKDKPHQSLAAAWTGVLAQSSGFDRVVTVDVHSPEDERLFPIPLISLSPAAIFGAALNRYQLATATIIAPDEGAIDRCEAIRAAARLPPVAIPWFEKHRVETGIQHTRFIGEVGVQAILVDDILDTDATLISACQRLLATGAEDIQIMVTHGLFTGNEWEKLWDLGVSRIFCTDTVSRPASVNAARIVTLSVVPLLAARWHPMIKPAREEAPTWRSRGNSRQRHRTPPRSRSVSVGSIKAGFRSRKNAPSAMRAISPGCTCRASRCPVALFRQTPRRSVGSPAKAT